MAETRNFVVINRNNTSSKDEMSRFIGWMMNFCGWFYFRLDPKLKRSYQDKTRIKTSWFDPTIVYEQFDSSKSAVDLYCALSERPTSEKNGCHWWSISTQLQATPAKAHHFGVEHFIWTQELRLYRIGTVRMYQMSYVL